ncbi:MAG TPA: CidA/LrgA family protein [Steroidobacteraceae bacterium]|nr:CidA/LrgA family protein [Steroidobacteraceae bacterium]
MNALKERALAALAGSRTGQIGLISGLWGLGCGVAHWAGSTFPGGLIGMLALLALMASGALDPKFVARGAGWLLAEMLLFFVPAVVALLAHPEFLGLTGLKVLVVIVGSTLMVMFSTALTVEWGMRLRSRHAQPAAILE